VPSGAEVNSYAVLLVKEATTLHKVLSKYLARSSVNGIMLQVVEAIWHGISAEYARVELLTDAAKAR
jgi:vacuolar protein sorting-associated protein 54